MAKLVFNSLSARLPSHREQSIDLLCKSIEWFVCEANTGTLWVKNNMLTRAGVCDLKI